VADAALVIEDGRIARVGSWPLVAAARPDAARGEGWERIDAGDAAVVPGYIDAHCHVAWGFRDPTWKAVEGDPAQSLLYAAHTAQRALAAGITTVGDCGSPGELTLALRAAIESGLAAGPRMFICGPAITTTAGHGDYLGISVTADTADELRVAVRQWVRRGVDFIKVMATGGSADPPSNRLRAQYSVAELTALVEDAHRLRRRVVAHVNGTEGIRNAVAAGVDALAHCNWLGAEEGVIEYDHAVTEEMARRGTMVDLNIEGALRPLAVDACPTRDHRRPTADHRPPGAIQQAGGSSPWPSVVGGRSSVVGWDEAWERPVTRWDIIRHMRDAAGVPVYVTSDFFGRRIAEFPRAFIRLTSEAGVAPLELIRMVTQAPAQGLGIDAEVGTLELGKAADLLLLDGDPMEDVAALTRVRAVFRGGRLVVENGRLFLTTL
jgi:imidazolonepropionase-like amidohydrolase